MGFRDQLTAVLRGDLAADLTPEAREQLETLAHDAQAEGQVVLLRNECAGRARQPHPSPAVDYLLAAACALNGEVERASQTLLALGEKLAEAKSWEPLAAVAERALALEETHAAARLLVRAHEGLGQEPARIEALERAWGLMPDDLELGLKLAVRLGDAGEGDRRRALLTELIPRFAERSEYAGLEEAALEFVEHGEVDGLVKLIRTLPQVATQGALKECQQLLGIAFPVVAAAGRAGEGHVALRETVAIAIERNGPAAGEPFRDALVEALRQGPGRECPDPDAVIAASGVADRLKPLAAALERFDLIVALPPGRAVHHDSFGAGRVASNDGEVVLIDFAHARGHRMPYAAARRTLTLLPEDDLRLLRVARPAEFKRLLADEPAEILARALKAVGGGADAQKLKVFLVGTGLVPAAEWTAFWRRARAAAPKHPGIDHARAFEQHYRLTPVRPAATTAAPEAGAGPDTTPLPGLEPRKSVKSNLQKLRKFLTQHPQAEAALAQRFGRFVQRAMADEEGDRSDRARAGLYVARWFPERAAEWAAVLQRLWDQGLAITDLANEDEQLAVLEASHVAGVDADAILSALDSRFSAVQSVAQRIRDALDEGGRAMLERTLLQHASRYPSAALRLIEEALGATGRERAPGWLVLWAALALIEERPKPSVADKVLRWLEPEGAFDRLLEGTECPNETRLKIRVLLRQWRSSDRFLFPALEALQRLGLGDEAETLRAHRQRRADKLFDRVGQQVEDADVPVMTRATWDRLQLELERLEKELRTTIPATIQKARELGDLRENAEFHSAKLKQANVSKLVAALQLRLARARFVDDMEYRDGVVGLGAEVVLESDEDVQTWWILGDSEHHHGAHVVSFQAPVGRALMGRAIGDEVALGEGAERRRYRIVSIERKLPPRETESAEDSRA